MFPFDFVRKAALRFPDRVAASEGARSVTFTELVGQAESLAAAFQVLSGKQRPVVAVLGPNGLDHFRAIMAVHAGLATLVPLNYRNTAAETADMVAAAQPDIIFADAEYHALIAGFVGPVVSNADGAWRHTIEALLIEFAGRAPDLPKVTAADRHAIKFTGGSSGKPKGLVQSFRCINTLIANMLLTFGFDENEIHLCVAPISHGAGTFMLPVLAAGGSNRMVRKADPAQLLEELDGGGATTIFLPPTMIYAIVEAAGDRCPGFGHLRHVIYGAAPMPAEKVRVSRAFFRNRLETVYGQTEMPTVMTAMTAVDMADERNHASVGRATPLVRIAIMDEDYRILGSGETGEVVATSDMMMDGYFEMPDKTAETIVDGWLHTGDVGMLDERGFLYLKDRLRDVVITGGFNVYPSDIEAVLVKHPAVYECVVFGVPDVKWGERVEAAVEIRAGQEASETELIAFVKSAAGSVKAPKVVHIVDRLPRSPVGKVQRREARELFGGGTALRVEGPA